MPKETYKKKYLNVGLLAFSECFSIIIMLVSLEAGKIGAIEFAENLHDICKLQAERQGLLWAFKSQISVPVVYLVQQNHISSNIATTPNPSQIFLLTMDQEFQLIGPFSFEPPQVIKAETNLLKWKSFPIDI